jgi:FAD:protein FMN transferase
VIGSRSRASGRLTSASWEALGTTVVLRLADADAEALAHARAHVECELDIIDRVCSRFRRDSELSRMNMWAGRSVQASPLLLEALELALRAARVTDGDVDPTVGRALELAGYGRDWRSLTPPRGEPAPPVMTLRARAGWQMVELDPVAGTVRMPAGVRLDLGATAKAWAADRAAAAAFAATGLPALVSLGGDVSTSGPSPNGDWRVRVTDDHRSDPSAPGQTVSIRSGGLATSSTTVRRWSHDGRTMHHIIDPATGLPAQTPWRTVSVAAANCAQANIATTAALVRGEAAQGWLAGIELPSRLQAWDGRVVALGGWPVERSAEDANQLHAGASGQ